MTATDPSAAQTARGVAIRRAVPPAVLHHTLKRPLTAPRAVAASPFGHRGPLLAMLAIMVFCGLAADFTEEAWPLAILLAVPLSALAYDAYARRHAETAALPRREPRIIADRRPVLLRPVLIVPQGRPAKIIAKLPRLLVQIPDRPGRRRPTLRRKSRILVGHFKP